MKKNIKKIQIFRLVVQLLMFVLSPALFILAFSGFKNIYEMIIKGDFNFIQVFPSLIEFVTSIVITIVLGRFFCGWICAFGTYNDLLHLLSKHIFKINFKVNEKLDGALKYVKYLVLLLLIVVANTVGSSVLDTTSPWDAFALITDFPQVLSDYFIGVVFLILITVGALFVERFFCRYLCPLGAVFNIFSKVGILKIKKPSEKCGNCRVCTNNCSMGLPLYKVVSVCGGDCITCFKCIETCPRSNTNVNVLGENINPELASSLAIASMVGLYGVSNLGGTALAKSGLTITASSSTSTASSSTTDASNGVESSDSSISTSSNDETGSSSNETSTTNNDETSTTNAIDDSASTATTDKVSYKDGTYTGTGTGYRRGTTEMAVTIKDNKITNIETVSNEDTPRFYENVESEMIDEMISAQSTSVDTISGATYSCEGILSATQDALTQAKA